MRETDALLAEAIHAARDGGELAQFNAHRAQLLGGKPPAPGERMPLEYSGVGGDVDPRVRK